MSIGATLPIGRVEVDVTNLDKVFYPKTGFTKGEVIDYYIKVSDCLLPHLKGRPVSLKRYPEGVEGFFFYEKQCPSHHPKWLKTAPVPKKDGGQIDYCVFDHLASLVWAANLANLELHTFLHKTPAIQRPTSLAFDLDPGPPADALLCAQVALWLRDLFASFDLECFPKTSGSKGLQVYLPLNTPATYEKTKPFAHEVARKLEQFAPEIIVSRMEKRLRRGKILVDWSQNDDKKTTVNVYSLRAKERPFVSTPLRWKEVEHAWKRRDASCLAFDSAAVLTRVKKHGDIFAPVLERKQKLPPLNALMKRKL